MKLSAELAAFSARLGHHFADPALLARARADGHLRVVEMNQRVATNLHRIIDALHDPHGEPQ